jgi:hypothetical protein
MGQTENITGIDLPPIVQETTMEVADIATELFEEDLAMDDVVDRDGDEDNLDGLLEEDVAQTDIIDEFTAIIDEINQIEMSLRRAIVTPTATRRTQDEILRLPYQGQLEAVRGSTVKDPTRLNYFQKVKRFLTWCKTRRTPNLEDDTLGPQQPFNPTILVRDLPEVLIQYLQTVVFKSCRSSSGFDQNVAALIK